MHTEFEPYTTGSFPKKMKFMEERGSGLKRMRDLLVDYGLREPRFTIHGGYFEVTFFGYEGKPRVTKITESVFEELNDRQKRILEILQSQKRITSAECVDIFDVSKPTVFRDLKQLIEYGIIDQIGKGPGTHYSLKEEQ